MKKLLTLLMAAAFILNMAVIPVMAAGSTIFETDFQSYAPDEIKLGVSQNVEIVEDELNPKDKVVVLEQNGIENPDQSDPGYAMMEVYIPDQTSTFTMEADLMVKTSGTWLQMFNGTSWPYGPGIILSSNGVSAYNGASLAGVEGTVMKQNDWIRVAVETNPATKKYKLFIDGNEIFENDFRNANMSVVNKIRFTHNTAGAKSYIDNIIVYSGAYSGVASKKVNLHAFDPMSEAYTPADESRYGLMPAPVMAEYYVDPNAKDGGTGTAQAPYNSIEKAVKAVRKANDKMSGDIIVHIKDGEYYIDETIMMTEDDDGTNGFNVIYRGETPGGAVLSGAKKLTGWTKHSGNIWKVPLEDAAYTLYQDDRRSIKARYPNREFNEEYVTYAGGYLVATGSSVMAESDKLYYTKNDLKNISFKDITDAKLCAWPWNERDWSRYTLDIEKVDTANGMIDCTSTAPSLGLGTRYYIEGMLELLDAEGEFHYDSDEKMLYYMPYGGKDPNTECSVYAPKEVEILNITGRSITPVTNIVFENLAFEKTNFLSSFSSWQSVYQGLDMGAVTLDTASDVKFLSCRFKNTGLSGLYIKGNSNYNYVYNCLFENMGLAGVILLSEDRNYSEYLRHNRISNCIIHDIGELAVDCSGVLIWSSQGTVIENCEIYNSPRSAFSLRSVCWEGSNPSTDNNLSGGRARHNVLRNTIIYEVEHDSGDTGAVHTAGVSYPGPNPNTNYFENIFIDTVYAHESMKDAAPNGYFGDYFSNYQSFKDMKVTNESGARNSYINSSFTNNTQLRYNTTDQNTGTYVNTSWTAGFDESKMNYKNMGVKADYPFELTPDYTRVKQAVILQQGAAAAINHGNLTYIDPNNHAVQPVNVSDRLLVPIRFIAESFGADVSWSDPVATVKLGSDVVEITKDSNIMKVNGEEKTIDVAATIINDRTMVPLRAIAEALGKEVNYYDGLVVITDVIGLFDEVRDCMTIQRLGNQLYYDYKPEKFDYKTVNYENQNYVITGTSLQDGQSYMLRTAGTHNAESYSVSRENGKVRLTIKENNYAIPYFREFDTPGANVTFVKDNGYLTISIDGNQVYHNAQSSATMLYGTYGGANTLTCQITGIGLADIDQSQPINLLLPYNQLGVGQEGTYYITATGTDGNLIDITHQGIEVTSSNPAVATVSDGKIIPVSSGTTTLTASAIINGKSENLTAEFTTTDKADMLLKGDFNLGSTSLIGWTLNGHGTAFINTSDDNRLRILANSGANVNAEALFIRAHSGKFSVECDFQVNFNPEKPSEGATPIYVHGGGAYAISTFAMNGQWGYHDGKQIVYVAPVESGKNYHLKCIGDTETDTFDLYVDGVLLMDDAPFRNKVESVNKIAFGTGGEPVGTEVFWDNVEIKAIFD